VRGVPLDAQGYFFEPLWTNFRFGANAGILDWYTILIGVAAYLALATHGALWVAYKCEGEVAARARRIAMLSFWAVIVVTLLITVISLRVQPQILLNLTAHPWGFVFPAIVIASLAGIFYYLRGASTSAKAHHAFVHSCGYLFGMLTSVAFGLYPYVLPARAGPAFSLSIYNSSTSDHALRIGLAWWIVGISLATAYFIFLYRRFSGPVRPGETHTYD
jgi:cytochrome bd ubiquinol oxidase subunit II